MMNEVVTQAAAYVGFVLVLLAVGFAADCLKQGIKLLAKKAEGIGNENLKSMANAALSRASYLATVTVKAIEQTTAGTLRTEVKAGVKDRDELLALGKQAVETVVNQLTPEYYTALEQTVSDVEKYVADLVETKLYELKNGLELT